MMIVALILAALACSFLPDGESSVPSGEVLFQDDFSKTTSGWDAVRTPGEGIADYENGAYRIQVLLPQTGVWANPGISLADVHIEVDAAKIGGPDDNDFGVICRFKDDQNFYFFVITSDGYYGIGKLKDGVQSLIGREEFLPSPYINQGQASNHIRADCHGATLALYANGQKLDEQQDADFSQGDVGLLAGTFDEPGTDILFDNFTVLKP
jgi:hypothetical protein